MRYLWEVIIEAQNEEIPIKELQFSHSSASSPYMEISFPCFNQQKLWGKREIMVNTYDRFYSIFKNMFPPEQEEYEDSRRGLTNLILHMLAENDVQKGMTKEEYYKQMLKTDIREGVFGESASLVFDEMTKEEQAYCLSAWLRGYKAGSSLAIFIDTIYNLYQDSVVYYNNDCPNEILIYTGSKKTEKTERRMNFLINLFLDLQYHVEIYYEHHFGIIGIEDTMMIDEIALY